VIRLAVRVERAHAEEALVELLAFSPGGVEEVEVDAGTIEYVIYGAAGELPSLPVLEASVGDCLVTVRTSEIADDWSERWREFHQPIDIAQRLHVRAPWHPPSPAPGLIDIVIEPGQAFGTGAHATSRLCLELLVSLEDAGAARGELLDVGCGSGILAIAAAKLGFAPVIALDDDPACIEASRANATANRASIDVRACDLRRDVLPSASTIVANLLLPLLLALSERLVHRPERLIASGLLVGQSGELERELEARHQLRWAASLRDRDWLAMLFVAAAPRVSSDQA
jgi:ribosomal protein L11 methyltransferase